MTTVAPVHRTVRVAVYARASVARDLEFDSVTAQVEAIGAYVASQRSFGWVLLPNAYIDDGYSGGDVDRPAFQRLMADVEAGRVDAVGCYKLDRISRSLFDFARIIEALDKRGVGLFSVTQQFSTQTSLGKLTLGILMSFAQFERETIAERIRDKMQASRKRGMWTGGRPVLGYDVIAKKLVINEPEAEQLRGIFTLYLASGSLRAAVAELRKRGWNNKSFVNRRGQTVVGEEFSKATVYSLLTNVLYRGQSRCQDGVVAGMHEPIVDAEVWTAVQERLKTNGKSGGARVKNKTGSLLRGLVRCGRCDSAMVHTFTTRGSRRYRYYLCMRAHNEGASACPNARVAAGPFESFVADQIRALGRDEAVLAKTSAAVAKLAADRRQEIAIELRRLEQERRRLADDQDRKQVERRLAEVRAEAEAIRDVDVEAVRAALSGFEPVWGQLFPAERERILRLLIERITYHPDGGKVEITLRPCGIDTLAAEARA